MPDPFQFRQDIVYRAKSGNRESYITYRDGIIRIKNNGREVDVPSKELENAISTLKRNAREQRQEYSKKRVPRKTAVSKMTTEELIASDLTADKMSPEQQADVFSALLDMGSLSFDPSKFDEDEEDR